MDELAIDLFVQNNDQSLIVKRTNQMDSSIYEENSYGFPYGNKILNLFNNIQVPSVSLTSIFYIIHVPLH